MILALLSSERSDWLLSQAFSAAIAMIGGIFVIVGLCMEKAAVKKWYSSHGDMKSSHKKENLGWWILMIGIFIEVAVAGGEAIKQGIEVRDLHQAQKKADPGKQPVFSASAFVRFTIAATNFIKAESQMIFSGNPATPVAGSLSFTRRSEPRDNIANLSLRSAKFFQFLNEISMELEWDPHFREIIGTNRNETCEELISNLNRGRFDAPLFKDPIAVTDANIALVLNGTVRKEFALGQYNSPPEHFPGVAFSIVEITTNKNATAIGTNRFPVTKIRLNQ